MEGRLRLPPKKQPRSEDLRLPAGQTDPSGQVSQVVKGLRQMATKHHLTGEKAKVVRDVTGYYTPTGKACATKSTSRTGGRS